MTSLDINNALDGARIQDLIGKMAGVSMRNTVRILTALQIMQEAMQIDLNEIARLPLGSSKPHPGQEDACDVTHTIFMDKAISRCPERVAQMRHLREAAR